MKDLIPMKGKFTRHPRTEWVYLILSVLATLLLIGLTMACSVLWYFILGGV